MNEITKKYYDELDDLLFYLRHNILQITSGVTEYDDDNLEEVFNENAKLKIKINKAIEYIKELQDSCIVFSNIAYKELLEILGDKELDEEPEDEEYEEYTLTKDENGTTQINGEWYRVDKK